MIEFLLLDLDDTILDFHKSESVAVRKALRAAGVDPTEDTVALYSRINKRLAKFTLGVTYSATRAQLETLMESIRAMLAAREDVWEDSVRVQFTGFGDSSLNILVQYYAKTGALADFLKIQEEVNLDLMGLMEQAGCEFAFPSVSIYREK